VYCNVILFLFLANIKGCYNVYGEKMQIYSVFNSIPIFRFNVRV